ncbi:MAG: rhomboid family intramembrane serine protease [Bacteroidota bacterium]
MNQLQLTPVVIRLLIINGALWLLLQIGLNVQPGLTEDIYTNYLSLWKLDILHYQAEPIRAYTSERFNPIQLVSSFFTHDASSLRHLLFNSIFLIFLGPMTERVLGTNRFIRFYMFCGVIGGLIVTLFDPSPSPVVGASGALYGVATAFAYYFPDTKLSLLFLPISFTARQMIIGLTAIAAFFVVMQVTGNEMGGRISHFGHLSGVVAAVLYFQIERYLPFKNN